MDELWSVGPILEGIGLNLTAWSYDGVLRVSALGCPESLPDAGVIVARLEEALAELDAATRSDRVRAVTGRPRPPAGRRRCLRPAPRPRRTVGARPSSGVGSPDSWPLASWPAPGSR